MFLSSVKKWSLSYKGKGKEGRKERGKEVGRKGGKERRREISLLELGKGIWRGLSNYWTLVSMMSIIMSVEIIFERKCPSFTSLLNPKLIFIIQGLWKMLLKNIGAVLPWLLLENSLQSSVECKDVINYKLNINDCHSLKPFWILALLTVGVIRHIWHWEAIWICERQAFPTLTILEGIKCWKICMYRMGAEKEQEIQPWGL